MGDELYSRPEEEQQNSLNKLRKHEPRAFKYYHQWLPLKKEYDAVNSEYSQKKKDYEKARDLREAEEKRQHEAASNIEPATGPSASAPATSEAGGDVSRRLAESENS